MNLMLSALLGFLTPESRYSETLNHEVQYSSGYCFGQYSMATCKILSNLTLQVSVQKNQKRNILEHKPIQKKKRKMNMTQEISLYIIQSNNIDSFIQLLSMSSGAPLKKRLYEQDIQFFPKQKSSRLKSHPKSDNPSQKLPYLYNKVYHNTIQAQKRSKCHKRSLSSYNITDFEAKQLRKEINLNKYLSSKVDFFNEENQRRLKLKKRKVMIDLGVIRLEKDKIVPGCSKLGSVSPGMAQLLHDYLVKRSIEENKSVSYYVLGREV